MLNLTAEEKKTLKGRGIILSRDQETFVARIVTVDGTLTSVQMQKLAEAAEEFGNGHVSLTIRLSVELQGIGYENIEPMCDFLAPYGLYTGGTGAKIRPIVACKGTVCTHGIYDTQELARELHERFYLGWRTETLPHKFKIAVGGCPNNCIKPSLNDFGVMGQRVPAYDPEKCRACKKCNVEACCPMKICHPCEDGRMTRQAESCTHCGKCIDACPFSAVSEEVRGFRIMVGGVWGKRQRIGDALPGVYNREDVFRLLERSLRIWQTQGNAGERFGLFIQRIGFEQFKTLLLEE